MRSTFLKSIFFFMLLLFAVSPEIFAQSAAQGGFRVLIDPAHGGTDPGVILPDKTAEKDITLALAVSLKKYLEESDPRIKVSLTRSSDKTVSIADRRNMVKKYKAALMVSLHANAGFGPDASGYEISLPGLKHLGGSASGEGVVTNMERTKYANDSIRLAQLIQKNLEIIFPRKGRGIREVPVLLLMGLSVPSVCVEVGFLTNKDDKGKILDKDAQKDVARSIGRGIRGFFD
ncbi:MAG: N-acetylmuramoyl-L-alanine amidase [Syntrophales bacterium]|jgi:N-acetylmuramoyl-L-alanine amidase|nr:N-acetylmuramoyl-L-alanine amidase [Syntrophales bacterium]